MHKVSCHPNAENAILTTPIGELIAAVEALFEYTHRRPIVIIPKQGILYVAYTLIIPFSTDVVALILSFVYCISKW